MRHSCIEVRFFGNFLDYEARLTGCARLFYRGLLGTYSNVLSPYLTPSTGGLVALKHISTVYQINQ